MTPDLHPDVAALAGLLGTWRGRGHGAYPTIEDFDYLEQVTFGHVGKPFLAYAQRTRDAATDQPLHAEVGYLRPGGQAGTAELVIAQPTGITEVHTGTLEVDDGHVLIDVRCDAPGLTPTARRVHSVRRRVLVEGDVLAYDLWMGHADTPETHHLNATLHRTETP